MAISKPVGSGLDVMTSGEEVCFVEIAFLVWLLLPRYPLLCLFTFLSALMQFDWILNLSLIYVDRIFFFSSWHEGRLLSRPMASLSSCATTLEDCMGESLVWERNSCSTFCRRVNTSSDGRCNAPLLNYFNSSNTALSLAVLVTFSTSAHLHSSQSEKPITLFTMYPARW